MNGPAGDARPYWRPATGADLDAINRIADSIHVGLPERPEVLADKFNLIRDACLVLLHGQDIVGYGISHPWLLFDVPALDRFLGQLPAAPDCLYIHDVAMLPVARGQGAAGAYVDLVAGLAHQHGIASLALVSVYNTHVAWARYGFSVVANERLDGKLASYGDTARYMVRRLD